MTKSKGKVSPAPKKRAKSRPDAKYAMPEEVRDWIDRANSIIQHLRGKVERLEQENKELKSYRKWAEQRILSSDFEK